MGSKKRILKKRDALGRRSDKVKRREREKMLKLLKAGYSVEEIANKLDRDPRTVRKYLAISEVEGKVPKEIKLPKGFRVLEVFDTPDGFKILKIQGANGKVFTIHKAPPWFRYEEWELVTRGEYGDTVIVDLKKVPRRRDFYRRNEVV